MLRIWRQKLHALTSREAAERLTKLEAAVAIQVYDRRRAEVNSVEGETVANLLQALGSVPSACITVGSLAILKYRLDGEPVFHARQLSAVEVRALERFPDLHKQPERFFESLADAARLLEIDPPASPAYDRRPAGDERPVRKGRWRVWSRR